MLKSAFVLAFISVFCSSSLLAATINVPGNQPTIQDGINAAISGVDEVVVDDGIYNEIIDFNGKAITVRSVNGAAVTTIDATGLSGSAVKCILGEGPGTILDGFTITNGSANGGGMFNNNSSPTVTNCTFSGNTAGSCGGGMYNLSGSSPTVTNCAFSGNTAPLGGGMYNSFSSSPTVTNSTFSGNTATNVGGGMHNLYSSSPTVTNCTFNGNTATNSGGGMYHLFSSSSTVTNSIFWGNSDAGGMDESAQIDTGGGTPVVNYSDVQGGWKGTGVFNINADPLFVDADGADNTVGTDDDDLRLSAGSPCIDAGNNSVVTEPTDLNGNSRIVNGTVDMGAYEVQGAPPATVPADRDGDGDVDGVDFSKFASCFNKAGNPPRTLGCDPDDQAALDFDDDGDIDGVDFSSFASCFNKAGNPPRTLGCPQN